MPNMGHRARRALKRVGIGIGVTFLMLNSYVTAWAALPRVGQLINCPAIQDFGNSSFFDPMWSYVNGEYPGSEALGTIWLHINAIEIKPGMWFPDTAVPEKKRRRDP